MNTYLKVLTVFTLFTLPFVGFSQRSREIHMPPERVEMERPSPPRERVQREYGTKVDHDVTRQPQSTSPSPELGDPIPNTTGTFVRGRPQVFGSFSMKQIAHIKSMFMASPALAHLWTYSSLSSLNTQNGIELAINTYFLVNWADISGILSDMENFKRSQVKDEISYTIFVLKEKKEQRKSNHQDISVEEAEVNFWQNFEKVIPDPVKNKDQRGDEEARKEARKRTPSSEGMADDLIIKVNGKNVRLREN